MIKIDLGNKSLINSTLDAVIIIDRHGKNCGVEFQRRISILVD